MLWPFAVAGSAGLLLGLWFRVPALIAASAMTAMIGVTAATYMRLDLLSAAGFTFALLGTLQVAYILGLALSCARSRAKTLLTERYALASNQGQGHFKVWARPGSPRAR